MVAKTEPYAPKLHKPATLDHLRKREPLERTVQIVMSDAPVEAVQLSIGMAAWATALARSAAAPKAAPASRRNRRGDAIVITDKDIVAPSDAGLRGPGSWACWGRSAAAEAWPRSGCRR